METRLALISIIVENREVVEQVNGLLSQFGDYIIGRIGIPYKQKGISLISVAIDAPSEIINSLTGKLGSIRGVTAKTLFNEI